MHYIPIGYMVKAFGHEMQPVSQINAAAQVREARRDRSLAGIRILGVNEPRGQSETNARLHQQETETEETKL